MAAPFATGPFEDSANALHYLKQHYKLVILSNVDNESFTHSNAKLQVEFDAIITAEDVGSYKPSPRNFEYMIGKLGERGIRKKKILHTAENLFHDHKPANEPDVVLDLSPACAAGLRRDDGPGLAAEDRFPLQQHGGSREGASGSLARR